MNLNMEHKIAYTALSPTETDEQGKTEPQLSRSMTNGALKIALLLSALLNILVLKNLHDLKGMTNTSRPSFSGLDFDTEIQYYPQSGYSSRNQSEREYLWEQMDTSPIIIALPDDSVKKQGVDVAPVRFPWDAEKGLYYVKVFHQIHCLKNLHRAFTDLSTIGETTISSTHIYHCLDAILQDVKCAGDDTPMPTYEQKHQIGSGQRMMCRNYEQLVKWAQQPERSACFKMLTDYGSVPNSLEQFAFCPPGSDYEGVQQAYFDTFGHKNPWQQTKE